MIKLSGVLTFKESPSPAESEQAELCPHPSIHYLLESFIDIDYKSITGLKQMTV